MRNRALARRVVWTTCYGSSLPRPTRNFERVDAEIVRFEHEPSNGEILGNIFRLVHTIKGTCGFLGLPRLEALAHATETLMSRFRDGMPVTSDAVTLVLSAIDRIKVILAEIEEKQGDEGGDDSDLIEQLHHLVQHSRVRSSPASAAPDDVKAQPASRGPVAAKDIAREKDAAEGSRDERERAANYSIRVQVETLDNLMTRVSELVLTRNQLLEMVRRHEESDFNVPLQRLSNVTAELQEGVMKTRMQPIGNAWQKLPGSCAIFAPNSKKTSSSKCMEPTRNSTAKSWSWSRIRLPILFATVRTMVSKVPLNGLRQASRVSERFGCRPATKAVTLSSRLPIMAAVSTSSGSVRLRSSTAC